MIFSGQSAKRSSRETLSPSYTMLFFSSIGAYHRKILVESFRERCNEAEEIANRNMGVRKQYSPINFHGGLTEGTSLILITIVHDSYTVVFGGAQTYSNTCEYTSFLTTSPRSLNYFWNFPQCANLRCMGHATMPIEWDDPPTVFYHYIKGFSRLQKFGLCLGKGNVSKNIQEPSCEYQSKEWTADTEPKRARYCSTVLLY